MSTTTNGSGITQAEFARQLGRAKSYITQLKREGRIVLTADGKVDPEASRAMIEATAGSRDDVAQRHAEAREKAPEAQSKAQRSKQRAEARKNVAQALSEVQQSKKHAEARIAIAKADQEEMERDKMAGKLVAREDVDFVLADFGASLRGLLDNLADRLAPVVAPLKTLEETHTAIAEAAEAMQQEMAALMRRRMDNMRHDHG